MLALLCAAVKSGAARGTAGARRAWERPDGGCRPWPAPQKL